MSVAKKLVAWLDTKPEEWIDTQEGLGEIYAEAQVEAAEQSGAGDGLHSCLCGDRIPLDEYRCSNCRALETTRA